MKTSKNKNRYSARMHELKCELPRFIRKKFPRTRTFNRFKLRQFLTYHQATFVQSKKILSH